eukprot:GHVR01060677.1.p1 GENE.GHVR01060677.1~~GHVR01060677.1.p1  ORF type:complete len:232 (-),score=118.47 GHVR01060677.1:496-1191(-)
MRFVTKDTHTKDIHTKGTHTRDIHPKDTHTKDTHTHTKDIMRENRLIKKKYEKLKMLYRDKDREAKTEKLKNLETETELRLQSQLMKESKTKQDKLEQLLYTEKERSKCILDQRRSLLRQQLDLQQEVDDVKVRLRHAMIKPRVHTGRSSTQVTNTANGSNCATSSTGGNTHTHTHLHTQDSTQSVCVTPVASRDFNRQHTHTLTHTHTHTHTHTNNKKMKNIILLRTRQS